VAPTGQVKWLKCRQVCFFFLFKLLRRRLYASFVFLSAALVLRGFLVCGCVCFYLINNRKKCPNSKRAKPLGTSTRQGRAWKKKRGKSNDRAKEQTSLTSVCEKLLSKQLQGGLIKPTQPHTHSHYSIGTCVRTHTGALVPTIMEYRRNWWSYFAAIAAAFRSILRSAALQRNSIRRGAALMVLATPSTHTNTHTDTCQSPPASA